MSQPLPTYFISHGGGPWPWVPQMRETFANLEASLKRMVAELGTRPRAVLMISGHWETDGFAVMGSARPPMVYDYYNFPEHTYRVSYPAPGAPELAERTAALIAAAGLPATVDAARGYDHGVFVPMAIMYPEADVPLYQVSLQHGYDPATHVALGRALAPLRDEGVLIVGSGLSFHNLALFGPGAKEPSEAFDAWLTDTLAQPPAARTAALLDWEQAPYARVCHKQEDHFAPLFAALGAAEDAPAQRIYHDTDLMGGVTASSYRFG
ncbi:class III extradiol ring-cleavage dioxygenase [Psychromarinibacter sp. C21-152]|uniref:Class III extradiol ring-cleavage dioxygenase n=1 Tax=Psychromarinibacter sediminicola TaxID=3033385 RepID=A0AAE3NWC6_9RHOB|nr:class III extradiol ring-cleavage dioxygenase [Psychromarinibacter sediminicola]MDF0603342.1 class III extradiol ring-cleavage dioxygenase [Psychromarinibacter sediminicola]